MQNQTISILGCGWLGVPLAKALLTGGYKVKGSVSSVEKTNKLEVEGIEPFVVKVYDSELVCSDFDFFKTDILIISIPPKRIPDIENIYPAQLEQIIQLIIRYEIKKVIFFSSTAVYPENNSLVIESDSRIDEKTNGAALINAENKLINRKDFDTTIIRFGGLIGADRNPARFLLKSNKPIANVPVNLIHQIDCIGIVLSIIEQEIWGEVFNACCPVHPKKREFYGKAAEISGLPMPNITDEISNYKIVDSSKLVKVLNYKFIYNSPIEYLGE